MLAPTLRSSFPRSILVASPILHALTLALVGAVMLVAAGAHAQSVVRIVGRDGGRHDVTRVTGTRYVPYASSYTVGNTVYTTTGVRAESVYGPVCTAPCMVVLPPGGTSLGVDGVATFQTVVPRSGDTLVVESDARDGWHALGWLVDLGGLAGGGALVLSILLDAGWAQSPSAPLPDLFDDEGEIARWIVAGATVLVTQIVGLALIGLRGLASVELVPGGVRF
ncbi:MAG: hypothetical protein K1X94_32800 [Sandaracinaceae bacterium]|nr:hypothetical protein [Sandaracinaceae bacterium]